MKKYFAVYLACIALLSGFLVSCKPADATYTPSTQTCFYAFLGAGTYLCPQVSANPNTIQGGTPGMYAYAFEDQFGINIHLADTEYNDATGLLNDLKFLNIHHVRDGLSVIPGNSYMISTLNTLGSNGIKADLISTKGYSTSTIGSYLGNINSSDVDALEGPNELDIASDGTWVADDQAEQQNIWAYAQANNPSLTIIGPSLGGPGDSYSQLGDLSAYETYGNTHDYGAGFYPENPGYGGPGFCGDLYGGIAYNLCNSKQASVSKPVIATEFGNQVNPTVTNDVDAGAVATYNLRQVLAHDSFGIPKSYIYALYDTGGQTYGLWSSDGNPRIGGIEIGQFMQILKDTTAVNASCTVPAYVSTSGVSSAGVCMSNGQYALILWQPVATWNPNTLTYGTFANINAVLTYSPGFAPTTVTQWSYPLNGQWSNAVVSPSSVLVSDRPSIVMFNGPSVPTPLPTVPATPSPTPSPTPTPTATPTPNPSATPTPTPSPTPSPTPTPVVYGTPSSFIMSSYYKNLNTSALAALAAPSATPGPGGYKYSVLKNYVTFAEAGVQSGAATTVNNIASVVPYVGGYMDVLNGCGSNASSSFTCLPDMNPEKAFGSTMPAGFWELYASGNRVMGTTAGFAYNQSTGTESSGNPCGSGSHTYTSTTYQNDCTLNPAVPLPTSSPFTYQKDPNNAYQRFRANLEGNSSAVSTVWNEQIAANLTSYNAATGALGSSPYNYQFSDDSFNPGDSASYPYFYSWANSSFGAGSFSLSALTGANYPYPNYNSSRYISGFASVLASSSVPAIINMSGYIPDSGGGVNGVAQPAPPSSVTACSTGCMGAMQESTWDQPYQSQNQPQAGTAWASQENLIRYLQNANKHFISYDHATNVPESNTFAAAVSTGGSQTVSVNGLVGVSVGGSITTTTNPETVTVTAVTANTLTATFANTHASGSGFTTDETAMGSGGLYARLYAYASQMLFCGDNVALCHTYTSYQLDTANDNPASGVYLPVEDTLVPATPLATPPPVWSSASPTTTGIYGLEDTTQASGATYACPSGGPTTGVNCVFVREYAQAYTFPGTRLTNGANHGVAYVVSPSTTGTYKFPTLTQTYAHGLQITGFDAVPGVSTSGTLNVTGTACPAAGTVIHGQVAYVCLP